jgi:hypothetical protein
MRTPRGAPDEEGGADMTTSTADQDTGQRLRELDERTSAAWRDYRSSLAELAGPEYETAEQISWERLQAELHELAGERERVAAGAAPS